MKIKEIIRILHTYQKWRRGANIQQPDPTEIGRAIDGAIRSREYLDCMDWPYPFIKPKEKQL